MPDITIQNAEEPPSRKPSDDTIMSWAAIALQNHDNSEITIRFVDEIEVRCLNKNFRGIDKPTNVLSFSNDASIDLPDDFQEPHYLGDVVICTSVVRHEAIEQQKFFEHHLAHIVIHGCLHLLGYDHENEEDALVMESLEIQLLSTLKISNPYQIKSQHEALLS